MSQSTAAENNIVFEENYNYFFVSKTPDKLEDDIEKNIVEKMIKEEAFQKQGVSQASVAAVQEG